MDTADAHHPTDELDPGVILPLSPIVVDPVDPEPGEVVSPIDTDEVPSLIEQPDDTDEPERSLLDELDERQNEVLEQLNALNGRIEALISDWTSRNRGVEAVDDSGEPETQTRAA